VTVVTYDWNRQQFEIDFEKASNEEIEYRNGPTPLKPGNLKQVVPFPLEENGAFDLDIFVDRSIIEIFVNSRIGMVQRVYPSRADSTQFRLFSEDGGVEVSQLRKWNMDATNPW
jgi:sucrose-6-phosphate hydrolase SacC (GH32 family)